MLYFVGENANADADVMQRAAGSKVWISFMIMIEVVVLMSICCDSCNVPVAVE